MNAPAPQPNTCPLCGLSNRCAMVSGSVLPCWCAQLDSNTPLSTLLPPDIPEQCICPACAQRLLQAQAAPRT